jgi:hypothetical protein
MNLLKQILPDNAAERFTVHEPLSLMDWTREANYTIDGNPCDLERIPWLRPIYEDESRVMVFRKGSQVAVSSYALARAFHGADQLGMRWMYFLPTDDEMDDFVADRVKGVIDASEHLLARMGNTDNVGLKKIGYDGGLIYFRGLWTKRRAKSVPADALIFDEVDELKPENVAFGEDRVLASRFQAKLYLSVPSFSNYGIDALFHASDQHFYLHKCPACGEWNSLDRDWPLNFLEIPANLKKSYPAGATHYRGCRWCGARLDVRYGEWVPEQPDNRTRGYHLSRLYTLTCPPDFPNPATYLWHEWESAQGNQERVGRFVIAFRGMPFDGEGARLTDKRLEDLEVDYGFLYRASGGTVMGLDQANRLHVSIYAVVGTALKLIYCEVTEDWDRAAELFRRFGCYVGGTDRVPDVHSARGLAHAFKGRMYLIDYAGDQVESKEGERIKRRVKDDLHKGKFQVPWVSVDRTNTLDATVELVDGGSVILPDRTKLSGIEISRYKEWRENVANLKWKFEDTPSGRRRVYIKSPNHHGMGLNYARIAAFELGAKPPPPDVMPRFGEFWGNA